MRAAPASAAPLIAESPMPPQPITATVSPGSTFAVRNTAPTPVMTPQPISAARSSGMSSRIFTTAFSCTSICSANRQRWANWWTASPPSRARRAALAGRRDRFAAAAARRVAGQAVLAVPAEDRETGDDVVAGLHVADLRADLLDDAGRLVAEHDRQRCRATARRRSGGRCGRRRRRRVRISTSCGPGLSIAISSISSGRPTSWSTAARISGSFLERA